ncbi:MAG TPA: SRPBCC family protein [Solirubrobacteraceae bacterium]|nr:SRPBCC family protein [Solirubrobacteraceae bacterium]
MRVAESIEVSAPPSVVWDVLADPTRYLHFLSGFTRWEVVSDEPGGVGARYKMLMRVGSAEIGGLIEVVEWVPERELAWTSVTGIDQRGRWRLRERPHDDHTTCTWVQMRFTAGVAGSGIFGWLAERFAAPTVSGHLRRSLQQLKRQVEHEELRARAAARRRARAASA